MTQSPNQFLQWIGTKSRPVRRRGNTYVQFIGLWIILGPMVLLGIVAIGASLVALVWAAAGTDRPAEITGVSITHPNRGSSIYRVHYRCQVNGTWITGDTTVPEADYQEYSQALAAHATASVPSTLLVRTIGPPPLVYEYALVDESPWTHAAAIWATSLILVALARGAFYLVYQVPARQKALYRDGTAVFGAIVQKLQRTQGKGIAYGLLYEFKSSDGHRQVNDQHVYRPSWVTAQTDQPVLVLYDPDDPERSVLYDYGDFAAEIPAGK